MENLEQRNDLVEKTKKMIRAGFDDVVNDTLKTGTGTFVDGVLIKYAITKFYQRMKFNKQLEDCCITNDIDYQNLLNIECKNTLNKYLEE